METYDLIPRAGNPRNSEGAFIENGPNELLFLYSAFSGEKARDYTHADIHGIRSTDNGHTWSEPWAVARARDYNAMNIMSVSLMRMQNGDIGLFYLVRRSWLDMSVVLQRSKDGGRTWSVPITCSTRKGYYVMNNDRAIRTSSGRILLPAAEHQNELTADGRLRFVPSRVVFFYSDDDGYAWHESDEHISLDIPLSQSGLQEPGIVELSRGHLFGWARTDMGRQYAFVSRDNGAHWSEARPSWFTSPLSPLSMKKLKNGALLAVWNPVPKNNLSQEDTVTDGRYPLVYARSTDEGSTWSQPQMIEDDPSAGYCYTAIYEHGTALYLAYCAGGIQDFGSCLNRLRIRRMPWTDEGLAP